MKSLSDKFKEQPTMEKIQSLMAWNLTCFLLTLSAYTKTFLWAY